MKAWQQLVKRAFDVSAAGVGLSATAPLMAAIAVAIKMDSPGPILFRQERLGRHGRVFRIFKFRTMRTDANVVISDNGKVVNSESDARHTRVGRRLRQYSLDELPQLFNVLLGQMSLVGPRPDLPGALQLYSERQRVKLSALPGITGLAQISGRNALEPQQKWDLDAEYAETPTLGKDMLILAKTARSVVARKGIY